MQLVTIGPNQAGQRFDKFLHKQLPEAGTSFLYKMLRKKNITLNGKKAEGKEILAVGDEVKFFFADETFEKFSGKKLNSGSQDSSTKEYEIAYTKLKGISILYEDDNILIVNKPVGILTQKAEGKDLSLNEWLIGYLFHSGALTKEEFATFHPSVCNRLDRNTSGIVLCGKSLAGSQALSRIIKDRTISKFYRTICVGRLEDEQKLQGYLCKDAASNKVTIRKEAVSSNDNYIETAYMPITANEDYTLLEVELITGKTHQIRAHLSSIKHPIIGDYKYGIRKINDACKKDFSLENQLLHAYRIVFPLDETGVLECIAGKEIIAPLPKQFEQIIESLKL